MDTDEVEAKAKIVQAKVSLQEAGTPDQALGVLDQVLSLWQTVANSNQGNNESQNNSDGWTEY